LLKALTTEDEGMKVSYLNAVGIAFAGVGDMENGVRYLRLALMKARAGGIPSLRRALVTICVCWLVRRARREMDLALALTCAFHCARRASPSLQRATAGNCQRSIHPGFSQSFEVNRERGASGRLQPRNPEAVRSAGHDAACLPAVRSSAQAYARASQSSRRFRRNYLRGAVQVELGEFSQRWSRSGPRCGFGPTIWPQVFVCRSSGLAG